MTRLIRALLYRISYRRYARFGANRILAGKELTPVVYRPKTKRPVSAGLSRRVSG